VIIAHRAFGQFCSAISQSLKAQVDPGAEFLGQSAANHHFAADFRVAEFFIG